MATANKGGRPATYQDVLDAPHHMVAEILDRILYTQWRSPIRHALAVARLAVELGNAFDRGCPGGWWIFREPELHLGADIVVPNLTGWSRAKMPDFPDGADFAIAPDWACEMLAPTTRRIDQCEKRSIYVHEGVSHLWFVDPAIKMLEVFKLHNGQWLLSGHACR